MLWIECIVLCLLMWGVCFVSTGSDEKNLIGYRSYPIGVQDRLKCLSKYQNKIKEPNIKRIFVSNFVVFAIVLFVFGWFVKEASYFDNFLNVLIMGEVLNIFDFLVIDLVWFRNTRRIRFSEIPEKEAYQGVKKHWDSFVRGCMMYVLIAIVDGILLTLLG